MTHPDPIYVMGFSAENFMRLESVDLQLTPEGGLTLFAGSNAQGKSSALAAIEATILGAGAVPSQPIRVGNEMAQTSVILGRSGAPAFTVTRKYRDSGTSSVEIRAADGTKVGSPQTLLDGFFQATTFNPVEWAFPPGEKTAAGRNEARLRMLLAISPLPIDLRTHDAEVKRIAQALAAARKRLKESGIVIGDRVETASTDVPQGPEEDESALVDTLAQARVAATTRQDMTRRLETLERDEAAARAQLRELEERIKRLVGDAADLRAKLAESSVVDTTATQSELVAMRDRNARRRAAAADIARAEERARQARRDQDEVDDLEKRAAELQRKRDEAIEAAKFPVRSLTILSDGTVAVRLRDGQTIPVEQCSTAQKVLLSFAIGSSRNPTLRTALIHDANDLDAESLATIARMARERGYQLIAERIEPSRSCAVSIVFKDGAASVLPSAPSSGEPK